MENALALAVKLMLTGMSTVFMILVLVVFLGKLIIFLTNKYSLTSPPILLKQGNNESNIDAKKLAVVISAVEAVTKGKGSITSIKKMN